jgi:hypothetical protein
LCQQHVQRRQVALLSGGEEVLSQLFSLPPRGVVAQRTFADVFASPRHQMAGTVHIGAEDLGDLQLRILEHLA